ncbi:MAG: hypothetical protein U1F09_14625 [Steroidobacteraceae bacterium]
MEIEKWLSELRIPREAYRLLTLLPLVHVAWADGRIQPAERKLIMGVAEQRGLLEHGGRATLELWLSTPPSAEQLHKDLRCLNVLSHERGGLADEFDEDSLQLLLAQCQDVADAAGGLLGLVPARRDAELAALKEIAAALDINDAKRWNSLQD